MKFANWEITLIRKFKKGVSIATLRKSFRIEVLEVEQIIRRWMEENER